MHTILSNLVGRGLTVNHAPIMEEVHSISSAEKPAPSNPTNAKERWKILRSAILSAATPQAQSKSQYSATPNSEGIVSASSVRSFSSFCLFQISEPELPPLVPLVTDQQAIHHQEQSHGFSRHADDSDNHSKVCYESALESGKWLKYSLEIRDVGDTCSVSRQEGLKKVVRAETLTRVLTSATSLKDMIGFNNTGNVCIWPSEEILAYYCIRNSELFSGKSVCELGCGMSALAGVMLASTQLPAHVLLTDGNVTSVDNVKTIVSVNRSRFGHTAVSSDVLRWDGSFLDAKSLYDCSFDWIICADCLFFEDLHLSLIETILKLLKPEGKALIFAPGRSGTMERFVSRAQKMFEVEREDRYDEVVWGEHKVMCDREGSSYKPDLHYPVLLRLSPLSMKIL